MPPSARPTNLRELRDSGWVSKSVKQEVRDNFLRMLAAGEELFPGIVGYDSTVIPEINIAILAGHDMLFLGEKGQAKSRLMRALVRFLDDKVPVGWWPREQRYAQRLSPGTKFADVIGEIDPAKLAGGTSMAS